MSTHRWQPIAPVPENSGPRPEYLSSLDSLNRLWLSAAGQDPKGTVQFLEQLLRRLAIETGIIEGIYTLDRGATETLVALGITPDRIPHGSTERDPEELVRILADHQDAVSGVYEEIRDGRPLTRSAVRQLHSTITRNQPTYRAVDQFGSAMDLRLDHGGFKSLPNNPTRPDGDVHEYCPPEHVDSEIDSLLAWHRECSEDPERYHPVLTAAWAHHRFTQIHPFQDGNGRVGRALLTWDLVRAGYLPAVIGRDDRAAYIAALERADEGDLERLVELLAGIIARTTLEALDGPEPADRPQTVAQALDLIVGRAGPQGSRKDPAPSAGKAIATLEEAASTWLVRQAQIISARMRDAGAPVETRVHRRRLEPAYLGGYLATAEAMERRRIPAAPGGPAGQARLEVTPRTGTGQPGFTFTMVFHHAGRRPRGAMFAASFSSAGRPGQGPQRYFQDPSPMFFSTMDEHGDLMPRLHAWAEGQLAGGLAWWAEHFTGRSA